MAVIMFLIGLGFSLLLSTFLYLGMVANGLLYYIQLPPAILAKFVAEFTFSNLKQLQELQSPDQSENFKCKIIARQS